MREFVLHGAEIHSRPEFHQQIAELMQFPEYYGRNLDALKDVLTDIAEDTCLIIAESAALEETLPTYYRSLGRVMKAASAENEHFTWRTE